MTRRYLRFLYRPALQAVLFALPFALAACGGGEQTGEANGLTGTVRVDGSSTVYPVTEAVAEEFMRSYPGVRATVGFSGTGGGFEKLMRKEIEISDASRPIKPSEVALAETNGIGYIELPVAYDGLAVVVNQQNTWVECLTVEELKAIWSPNSEVQNWSQIRAGFPDQPLALYGPGTDSGTYDYFTAAVVGEEGSSRTDFTASEDDNVLVQGVSGDPNALGFFGLAYFEENQERLKLVGIDNGNPEDGEGCILPSSDTVRDGTYQPLARPVFIYVREDAASDAALETFVTFYLENVGQLAPEVGYVPLSDEAYDLALRRFANRTTGSVFEGHGSQAGVRVEDLLNREGGAAAQDTTAAL